MTSPTNIIDEKRKFARYNLQPKIFAALGKEFSRVGRVKDVSMGGLAFEYIADQHDENELCRIDIFATGNGFHLSRIPCRKIYEVPEEGSGETSSLSTELRTKRCGVKFGDLTESQADKIKKLIEAYMTHKVQS